MEKETPVANYSGLLKIGDYEIPCAVIKQDDKVIRLVVQRQFMGLLTGNTKGGLDRYFTPKNLAPFVPEKFKNTSVQEASLIFEINGRKAYGLEAEDIVDICKMYMTAKSKGVLLPKQIHLAEQAEIIITALAKTGIVGLIDEATGYQSIREKDALQKYLETVVRKELAVWVQRFPNDFFYEIYRLKGWSWTGRKARPGVVGTYINDIVYDRLGPGIKEELQNKNPKTEKGYRKVRHHQWLTDDVGHPKLANHLFAVMALMRASKTWDGFIRLLNQSFPKSGTNLTLFEEQE